MVQQNNWTRIDRMNLNNWRDCCCNPDLDRWKGHGRLDKGLSCKKLMWAKSYSSWEFWRGAGSCSNNKLTCPTALESHFVGRLLDILTEVSPTARPKYFRHRHALSQPCPAIFRERQWSQWAQRSQRSWQGEWKKKCANEASNLWSLVTCRSFWAVWYLGFLNHVSGLVWRNHIWIIGHPWYIVLFWWERHLNAFKMK